MNPFITAISTGITAFTATNLDDIVILLLFFDGNTLLQDNILGSQHWCCLVFLASLAV